MKDGYDADFALGYAPDEWLEYNGYMAKLSRHSNLKWGVPEWAVPDDEYSRYYYVWNIYRNPKIGGFHSSSLNQMVGTLHDSNPSPNVVNDYSPGSLYIAILPHDYGRDTILNFQGNVKDAIDYINNEAAEYAAFLSLKPVKPSK